MSLAVNPTPTSAVVTPEQALHVDGARETGLQEQPSLSSAKQESGESIVLGDNPTGESSLLGICRNLCNDTTNIIVI